MQLLEGSGSRRAAQGGQQGTAPVQPTAGGLQEASLQAELHPRAPTRRVGGGMAGDRGRVQQGGLARVVLGAELQLAGHCPPGCPLTPLRCRAAAPLSPRFPPTRRCQAGSGHAARCRGGAHAARPRASRGRMGGSRAQRCNKALIAISRHLAFFYVQFILEASIVSEAK